MLRKVIGKITLAVVLIFVAVAGGCAALMLTKGQTEVAAMFIVVLVVIVLMNAPASTKDVFQKLILLVPVPPRTTPSGAALLLGYDDAKIYAALEHCFKGVDTHGIVLKYRGVRIYDPDSKTFEIKGEKLRPKFIRVLKQTK